MSRIKRREEQARENHILVANKYEQRRGENCHFFFSSSLLTSSFVPIDNIPSVVTERGHIFV